MLVCDLGKGEVGAIFKERIILSVMLVGDYRKGEVSVRFE